MDTVTLIAILTGITGAIGGVSGAAYSFIKAGAERKKIISSTQVDTVDIAEKIASASSQLIEQYRKESEETRKEILKLELEVMELKKDIASLKAQNLLLIKGIVILLKQLERLQVKPEWEPTDDEISLMEILRKEGEMK